MKVSDANLISYDVEFVKLDERAVLPAYSEGNIGFDVRTIDDCTIEPGKTVKLRTGLALAKSPPKVMFFDVLMKLEQRSGLASNSVFPVGGIIDPSYRGEICVLLHNSSNVSYEVDQGDKVAQFVFYVVLAERVKLHVVDEQDITSRGTNGFGSSGR